MHALSIAMSTVRLGVTLALALAVAPVSIAQETPPDPAPPATRRLGPGAPQAATKPGAPGKPVAAARGYQLARTATVSSSVHVHDKVLQECRITTVLPQMVAERSPDILTLADSPGPNRLELKIVDIHSPNGGWFSGPKWITVEGRLLQGRTVKGDFIAKETSMASATACGMLHKVMFVLAGDIAAWLENPSRDSRIGRAR